MPYSTLFYRNTPAAGTTIIYTVPASYVAIVRELDVFNGTGNVLSLTNLEAGPGTPSVLFWISGALAENAVAQWKGRVVLNAGDVVQLFAEYAGLHVTMSGYLLSSP